FDRPRPPWLGTAHRQLRNPGRANPDSGCRFLDRARRLLAGALWHSQRDQRLSGRVWSGSDAAAAATGAAAGLSAVPTTVAHTPAPTAACAAWSAPGNPSSTIAAAIATCSATIAR